MKYIEQKRRIDLMLSLIGLIILAPLFFGIMIAIKIESKGPVFFRQKRVGINQTHFNILKFRTMYYNAPSDTPTHLLDNPEMYITKIGQFLRKTSLDELPQIINIVKGEMAIIGPRPALWNQYDLIKIREIHGVNEILPGLTGWAQVNGRDELSIELKAKLDREYLEKMSLKTDLICFIKTISAVFTKKGIAEGKSN